MSSKDALGAPAPARQGFSPEAFLRGLNEVLRSPYFPPATLAIIGIAICFYSLWRVLPELYLSDDGYYSHGPLIPLMSGYAVYLRWPELLKRAIKPSWIPLLFILPLIFILRAANAAQINSVLSVALILMILLSIWFVAGWKWMLGLLTPTLYLIFGLPVWSTLLDNYTNPLQLVSTKVAFQMLKVIGENPIQLDPTTVMLDRFTLSVAVPCSGVKLMLALTAFTAYFMMIAKLKWWGNVGMMALLFPLAIMINGLRIGLIGIVGNAYGEDAGHQFHDYSGYITLIVCFYILFKVARLLGWRN